MNPKIDELLARIRELEAELQQDLEAKREEFRYHLENRRIRFEQEILALHRRYRKSTLRFIVEAPLSYLLSAPVIYAGILPLALLDLFVSLYQLICFPVYRIPRVRRLEYFIYDRGLLPYLNWIERLNCLYCSYATGLINYSREIVARTEQFWCPIKHARLARDSHLYYPNFFDYGDVQRYRAELEELRAHAYQAQDGKRDDGKPG